MTPYYGSPVQRVRTASSVGRGPNYSIRRSAVALRLPSGVARHPTREEEPSTASIADIAPLARSKIKKPSTEVANLVGSTF